jgi:hypothetical protein
MTVGIVIQFAAWLASFGLIGVVVVRYEQADAAQEKLANEWALSRREMQRTLRAPQDRYF